MTLSNKSFYKIFLIICPAVAISACGEDSEVTHYDRNEDTLNIFANINDENHTRIYQESGTVNEGNFFLTYPLTSDIKTEEQPYNIIQVVFKEATGIALVPEGGELKWENIGYDSPKTQATTFYLDNFAFGNQTDTLIDLKNNPVYDAARLDKTTGANDLLWGTFSVDNRNDRTLGFNLYHRMSRFSVKILVDNSEMNENLNLADAKVELSDVIISAESYNRIKGELSLSSQPLYSTLSIIDDSQDWSINGEPLSENPDIFCYKSLDFVIPPQELKKDLTRPKIIITVPKENENPMVYEAVLPTTMTVESQSGGSKIPMTLAFLKGLNLSLTVKLNSRLPEITFMPVTVGDWYEHSNISLSANQAGIYSEEDFYSLIEAFLDGDSSVLKRYGYQKEDNSWKFNIYIDGLTPDFGQIEGKLNGKDFSFDFHGHTIMISHDGKIEYLDPTEEGAEKLNKILTEGKFE